MTAPDFLQACAISGSHGETLVYGEVSTDNEPAGWLRVAFRQPGRKKFLSTAEVLRERNATLNIEFAPGNEPAPPVAEFVDDLFRESELDFLIGELRAGKLTYLDRPYAIRWLTGNERETIAAEVFEDLL